MYPVLFELGDFQIRSYGVIVAFFYRALDEHEGGREETTRPEAGAGF